ncbi:hypothetical protein Plhal304r1_c005g0020271 [Plasmopara halstedii]
MRLYCKQQRGSTIIVGVDDQLAALSRLELVDVPNQEIMTDYHSSKYGVEDSNTAKLPAGNESEEKDEGVEPKASDKSERKPTIKMSSLACSSHVLRGEYDRS